MDNKNLINRFTSTSMIIAIVILILIGISFRTHCWLINSGSFFFDEGSIVLIIQKPIYTFFFPLEHEQCCPILFLLLAKIIYNIYGLNEIALRFLPYFISIISLLAFVFLQFKIFKNKISIILGTLLFIYNVQIIRYSVIFKHYIFDILSCILILLGAIYLRNKVLTKKHYLMLGLICSLFIFVSFTSVILITSLIFSYILYKFFNTSTRQELKESLKNISFSLIPYFSILILFLLSYFIPILQHHYLHEFWNNQIVEHCCSLFFYPKSWGDLNLLTCNLLSVYVINVVFLLFISLYFMFEKDKYLFTILVSPLLFSLIFALLYIYPLSADRVSIYLLPILFLIISYVFEILSKEKIILSIVIILLFLFYLAKLNIPKIIQNSFVPNSIEISNSKYFLEKLYNVGANSDEYFFSQTGNCFKTYDKEKKFKDEHIISEPVKLDNLSSKSVIYFYTSEKYNAFFHETKILREWINNNCIILMNSEDKYGSFVKCKKK